MKVKMLTLQAGPQGVREVGHVYDVPDKEARMLIDGGYAVEAKREMPVERAVRVATNRRGRVANPESDASENSKDGEEEEEKE